jgi:hypothetical protein
MRAEDPVCAEPKLFVGGLRFDATQDDVSALFAKHGPLRTCVLLKHADTGRSKGCAMVAYEKWAHAETAAEAENGGAELAGEGRTLIVKFADPSRRAEDGRVVGVTPKKLFVGQVCFVFVIGGVRVCVWSAGRVALARAFALPFGLQYTRCELVHAALSDSATPLDVACVRALFDGRRRVRRRRQRRAAAARGGGGAPTTQHTSQNTSPKGADGVHRGRRARDVLAVRQPRRRARHAQGARHR